MRFHFSLALLLAATGLVPSTVAIPVSSDSSSSIHLVRRTPLYGRPGVNSGEYGNQEMQSIQMATESRDHADMAASHTTEKDHHAGVMQQATNKMADRNAHGGYRPLHEASGHMGHLERQYDTAKTAYTAAERKANVEYRHSHVKDELSLAHHEANNGNPNKAAVHEAYAEHLHSLPSSQFANGNKPAIPDHLNRLVPPQHVRQPAEPRYITEFPPESHHRDAGQSRGPRPMGGPRN